MLKPGDRLPWRSNLHSPHQPAYAARPEGEDMAPYVGVAYDKASPEWSAWRWSVSWPGRFHEIGATGSKQAAADMATAAYWKHIAATPDWALPTETKVPAVVATLPRLTDDELIALGDRYFTAVSRGNTATIETTRYREQWAYREVMDELRRRKLTP